MDYREAIQKSGYRKNFLAEKIGVSPTMISLFLSGKKNLAPERLRRLNRILGIK